MILPCPSPVNLLSTPPKLLKRHKRAISPSDAPPSRPTLQPLYDLGEGVQTDAEAATLNGEKGYPIVQLTEKGTNIVKEQATGIYIRRSTKNETGKNLTRRSKNADASEFTNSHASNFFVPICQIYFLDKA